MAKIKKANPVGRPPIFSSPEDMEAKFDEYINICKEDKQPILLIGFAVFMKSHKSMLDKYKEKEEFSGAIKQIQTACEMNLISGAMSGVWNPTVSIFLAKNNHGYKDKSEMALEGGEKPIELKWEVEVVDPDE